MDYHNAVRECLGELYHLKNGSNHDMTKSKCMLNDFTMTQDKEDMSYMLKERTPIKACSDFAYHFDDSENKIRTPQECKEYTPQVKRRRVLDFDNAIDDIPSSFLKSKEMIDSLDDITFLPEISQWEACLQEDLCFEDLCFGDLIQAEAWLADCLIDTNMNIRSSDGNASVTSDIHIAVKDCNVAPHPEPIMSQRPVRMRSSRNIIFQGKKSYMRTPTKLASCVVYPFDFIKPCGVLGDVTLKDINQRIHTPPSAKRKRKEELEYPTSAFSGKPVVGKTKISTQRGKGSITIMRTEG